MKKVDREKLQGIVDNEGFDYTFIYYSTFPEILDKEFQRLRENYVRAANALAGYLKID